VIQPAVVAQTVAELSETYDLQLLAYDRWRINDFTRELDNIGAQIPMQPFGQGFRDMSPAVDKLERLVAERKLCHGGNPILNMCAAGAVVQSDPAGNRKLHKAKSYSKIDGLVALAMALGCMSADDLTQPSSPWDDPDFKLAV
jgi:phage terminase large subunit-like protein